MFNGLGGKCKMSLNIVGWSFVGNGYTHITFQLFHDVSMSLQKGSSDFQWGKKMAMFMTFSEWLFYNSSTVVVM